MFVVQEVFTQNVTLKQSALWLFFIVVFMFIRTYTYCSEFDQVFVFSVPYLAYINITRDYEVVVNYHYCWCFCIRLLICFTFSL